MTAENCAKAYRVRLREALRIDPTLEGLFTPEEGATAIASLSMLKPDREQIKRNQSQLKERLMKDLRREIKKRKATKQPINRDQIKYWSFGEA